MARNPTTGSRQFRDADYVIIGAGSAGCVLANRLSVHDGTRVLILEHGGSDASITVAMPSGLSMPMKSKRFNWGLASEPEPYLGGRSINLPRGKGLGGSSSINGMCYVRGNPMDYELWAGLGATGWNWRSVLPYFQRAESVSLYGPLRGHEGPLRITRGAGKNPLYGAFIRAGAQAGYATSPCMNELQHEGFGPMEMTVADGRRCSTARAYLHPVRSRPNLKILTHATVQRIVIEENAAVGVEFFYKGHVHRVHARGEVILAAGSIMSPTILMRSGLGPERELRNADVPVIRDCAEVGGNLMDHLEMHVQYGCAQPVSLRPNVTPWGKLKVGAHWILNRRGLGATNHFESGGHIRSRAGIPYPDIQYHFLPLAVSYDGSTVAQGHGFQVHVGTKRSKSRGTVRLDPRDPLGPPKVLFNYMSHPDDWPDMRACIRLSREIFTQPAMAPYRDEEIAPGADRSDDTALDAFIREHAVTAHHPCGTCRMGNDESAVVDPQCRFNGIDRLRVIDSSVFPQATAGDLNAPTIMLAERAADIILDRTLPEAAYAPILVDPDWATRQRSSGITLDLSSESRRLDEAVGAAIEQTRPGSFDSDTQGPALYQRAKPI